MEHMTKKEAAEYLKVSERTIDNYIAEGLLTPHYPGGVPGKKLVFPRDQVVIFFRPTPPELSKA